MSSDLNRAREWAEGDFDQAYIHDGPRAAADLIKSLPDQWVDAEKVQAMIDNYKHARDSNAEGTEGWVINHLMVSNLESLLAPTLPTLADMPPGERRVCQWMQCVVKTDAGDAIGVIYRVWSRRVDVIFQSGAIFEVEHRRVTPLSGEPKLKWPSLVISGESETVSVETEDVTEEPKPGQAWLVKLEGKEYEALIVDHSSYPWVLHDPEEVDLYRWCDRDEVTPIRRLRADAKETT